MNKLSLFIISLIFITMITPVSYAAYSPHDIVITEKYIYATAKPSGVSYLPYTYTTRVFYNQHPITGAWGGFQYVGKGYEGDWTWRDPGRYYDQDFCMISGKEKISGSSISLKPYDGVINGLVVKDGYFTGERTPNTGNDVVKDKSVLTVRSLFSVSWVVLIL